MYLPLIRVPQMLCSRLQPQHRLKISKDDRKTHLWTADGPPPNCRLPRPCFAANCRATICSRVACLMATLLGCGPACASTTPTGSSGLTSVLSESEDEGAAATSARKEQRRNGRSVERIIRGDYGSIASLQEQEIHREQEDAVHVQFLADPRRYCRRHCASWPAGRLAGG
jgi:hypothetical protein